MTVARQLELAIPELENLMQPAWLQVMPVSLQRNTMVSITKFSSQKFIHKNEIKRWCQQSPHGTNLDVCSWRRMSHAWDAGDQCLGLLLPRIAWSWTKEAAVPYLIRPDRRPYHARSLRPCLPGAAVERRTGSAASFFL